MSKFRKYVGEFASETILLMIEKTVGLRQTVAKLTYHVERTIIEHFHPHSVGEPSLEEGSALGPRG
jgi:hypothetical protein